MKYLWLFMFLLAVPSWAVPTDKPFELYPPTNGAAPTTFTKAAMPFQVEGKPWKFAHGAKVQVKVDAAQVLRKITPYQFGSNVACWDNKQFMNDPDCQEKVRQAGIKFWRWPGGSTSDNYHWDGNYGDHTRDHDGGNPPNMNAAWAASTDDFISFCQNTNSEAIVTVNYAAARYENVQYAADMAARWVHYFNFEKKFKVRYWEIGNENFGPWEEGNKMVGKPQLTGDVYGKDLQVIAAAMRKVDPDIFVGAVAVDKDSGDDWNGYHWWMRDLLPQLQQKVDFLIFHEYFIWPFDSANNYTNPSNQALLSNLHEIPDGKTAIEGMEDKYAPAEKGLPIALTEFNMINGDPPPTIQLLNGIFVAEVLGEMIKAGYKNANIWDLKNGLDDKLKGDHGLLGYKDPGIPEGTPRPTYYSYAIYSRAFGDTLVSADSSDPTVKVYASRFSGGELGFVIVNENDQNRTAVFDLAGFKPQGKLMGWVMTGQNLNDYQVSFNGELGPAGGGGPFPIKTIPPYRATFKTDKPLQLPLQARSVTGLILY